MCTWKKQMPLFMPHPPELSPDSPRAWARDKCNNDVWNDGSGWCRQCFRSVGFQAFFQANFAQPLTEKSLKAQQGSKRWHRSSSDPSEIHSAPSVSEAHRDSLGTIRIRSRILILSRRGTEWPVLQLTLQSCPLDLQVVELI